MKYRPSNEKKHYILKGILAVLIAFLVYVAIADVKPTITQVEKTIPNALNK